MTLCMQIPKTKKYGLTSKYKPIIYTRTILVCNRSKADAPVPNTAEIVALINTVKEAGEL